MDIIKAFLIGGSVLAGSFVTKHVSPAFAPIVGGLPTGILVTFFMDTDETRRLYYKSYVYSSFLLFLAVLICHLWSSNTTTSVNLISSICILVWASLSYLVINYFVIKK